MSMTKAERWERWREAERLRLSAKRRELYQEYLDFQREWARLKEAGEKKAASQLSRRWKKHFDAENDVFGESLLKAGFIRKDLNP